MKRLGSFLKREPSGLHGNRRRSRRPSNLTFSADHSASAANSVLQSMLTLYGLMALMLGVVIPISDALAKPVEHADYRQVFYVFMHGLGIGCILYLNTLISCHQHHRACDFAPAVSQASAPAADAAAADNVNGEGGEDLAVELDVKPSAALVCFSPQQQQPPSDLDGGIIGELDTSTLLSTSSRNGGNHYVTMEVDPSRAPTLCARSGAGGSGDGGAGDGDTRQVQIELATSVEYEEAGPQRADDLLAGDSPAAEPALSLAASTPGYASRLRRHSVHGRRAMAQVQRKFSRTWRSTYAPAPVAGQKCPDKKITWSAVGVNLYLRLGAIVFGFGVMVHDGFKIADVLERPGSEACVGPWFLPKHGIHLLFIMCQTYYVFKHHRVAISAQKTVVRFIFVHLIVTNLCIWVKTVIYEIKVGLTYSSEHMGGRHSQNTSESRESHSTNATDYHNGTGGECLVKFIEEDSPSYKLGPYLYPCAVEYGLICAAICYKFFSRVGDTEVVAYGMKENPVGPRSTTCHKSHKGLFLGLIVMICVLVPVISLIFLQKVDGTRYRNLYILAVILIECSVLCSTTAMALVGTAKAIRNLRLFKVRGNEAFDVNLLFVGLAGIVCYNLFVTISVGACLMDTSEGDHCKWGGLHQLYITKANGLKSLLEVVQSVTQTLFIMQAIQRKVSAQLIEGQHKPGRGLTIALLISNLAMWIASVFEAQRNIAEQFLLNYFGQMPWNIIKYIFLPLIIFFRFHSTVCLSEIWIQSYKPAKAHHHHQ